MHVTIQLVVRTIAAAATCWGVAVGPIAAASPVVEDPDAPSIVGMVQDEAGNPLPNARITVPEVNRSTTTAADGTFVLRSLRPGTYHLDASLLGYAPEHQVVTVPEAGDEIRVTFTLVPSPLALEGINVTASPRGSDALGVTQATVQLSGKELERNLSTSLAQTLSDQPGMSVRYAGPAATVPVIRGLTGERILVLQNGQRTADLSSTSPDHGLTIDPLSANRLEVVRGPASLLYGNNALGGVVNVITTEIPTSVPNHYEGFFAAQGESASPGGAGAAEVVLPLSESLALNLRGGGRSVDDVRVGGDDVLDNTQFRNLQGGAGLGYVAERLSGGVAVNAYGFGYGLPAAPDAAETGVTLEGRRAEAKARAEIGLGTVTFPDLRIDGTAQWYTHDEIEDSGEVSTTFELQTQTLNATTRTEFGRLRGALGLSGIFKQYEPTGEEALTPPANSNGIGVFLFQEIPITTGDHELQNAPRLQVGARYDSYRIDSEEAEGDFGPARSLDFGSVSASVGITLPVGEGVSLGGSVARAFRAPTVEELFSNAFHAAVGTFDRGNPDLEAETNLGGEVVLRAQSPGVTGQLAAYANRIDDYIFPNIVGDIEVTEEDGEQFVVPLNVFGQADALLVGIEGGVDVAVTRRLVLGAMGDIVRGEFIDAGPLPFMPAGRLGGSGRWESGPVSVGAEVRHTFGQGDVPAAELSTDAYTLFNLDFGYSLIRGGQVHTVTLGVDNVFDEHYRDATSRIKDFAPNPGRNISLIYKVLF